MRHRVPGNRLNRPHDQHRAVLRSLATELLRHDEIFTTLSKAKAVRSEAEKMITLAKRSHLADYADLQKKLASHVHVRRQIAAYVYDKEVVSRVYDVVAPRYESRQGGYTRIIRAGYRRGDAAPMALIQLV